MIYSPEPESHDYVTFISLKYLVMKEKDTLIRIFTGTEISVLLLKGILEEAGIAASVRNDYQLGVDIGAVLGARSAVDLYIRQPDFEKAVPLVNEFLKQQKP